MGIQKHGGRILMGIYHFAKCNIEFPKDTPNSIFENIWKKIEDHSEIFNSEKFKIENHYKQSIKWSSIQQIDFELEGNNGVNYEPIHEIQKEILKILHEFPHTKEGLIISCNEFSEACDGYYFEYGDDES